MSLGADKSKVKKILISKYIILVLTTSTIHYFARKNIPMSDYENIEKDHDRTCPNTEKIKLELTPSNDLFSLDVNGNVWYLKDSAFTKRKINISNIIKIYCSDYNYFFLTKYHELYAYGLNISGTLGVGHNDDCASDNLQQVKLKNVVSIAQMVDHCMALTLDGKIYMWGNIWECRGRSDIKVKNDVPLYSNVPIEVFKI
jgi:alpha-tubulin suppressor-like RCC1 family protein